MQPTVNNFLLCDYLSFDGQKASCCGIFHVVAVSEFPYLFNFYIYADLSGNRSKNRLKVEIRNVFTDYLLCNVDAIADLKDPLRGLTIMLKMKVILQESGAYSVNLISNGELIKSTKLEVIGGKNNDPVEENS